MNPLERANCPKKNGTSLFQFAARYMLFFLVQLILDTANVYVKCNGLAVASHVHNLS